MGFQWTYRHDLVYSHTGYHIVSYFRSAFLEVRKQLKMPHPTVLGRILVAAFCLHHQLVGFLLDKANRRMAFCYQRLPRSALFVRRHSFVRHKVSGSDILRTVLPRNTKFYTDIHADLLSTATPDMTSPAASSLRLSKFEKTAEHAAT